MITLKRGQGKGNGRGPGDAWGAPPQNWDAHEDSDNEQASGGCLVRMDLNQEQVNTYWTIVNTKLGKDLWKGRR